MKTLSLLVVVLLLTVGCSRAPKHCAVCQRAECVGLAFRVELTNGKTVETCCPRCGLHYVANQKADVRHFWASDYANGQWIDATKAIYVSGSDVSSCAIKEAMRDPQGCCLMKNYDRCLPSLIAFASPEAAQSFAKQHGGDLLTWGKVESIR